MVFWFSHYGILFGQINIYVYIYISNQNEWEFFTRIYSQISMNHSVHRVLGADAYSYYYVNLNYCLGMFLYSTTRTKSKSFKQHSHM